MTSSQRTNPPAAFVTQVRKSEGRGQSDTLRPTGSDVDGGQGEMGDGVDQPTCREKKRDRK